MVKAFLKKNDVLFQDDTFHFKVRRIHSNPLKFLINCLEPYFNEFFESLNSQPTIDCYPNGFSLLFFGDWNLCIF